MFDNHFHGNVQNVTIIQIVNQPQQDSRIEDPKKPKKNFWERVKLVIAWCGSVFKNIKEIIFLAIMRLLLFPLSLLLVVTGTSQQNSENSTIYHGSTVIAFISKDSIWISADTKVNVHHVDTKVNSNSTSRKVFITNSIGYAFTGISRLDKGYKSFFEPTLIMEYFIQKLRDFNKVFEAFNDSIVRKMETFHSQLHPETFKELLKKNMRDPLLDVLIVAYNNGTPIYKQRSYGLNITNPKKAEIRVDYSYRGIDEILLLGYKNSAMEYITKNNYFKNYNGMRNKLTCLIKIEAEKNKNVVGMPVEILILPKKGKHIWSLNRNTCL